VECREEDTGRRGKSTASTKMGRCSARQTGHGRSLEREQQWTANQKDLALVLDSELEAATRYRQKFQALVRVETFLGLMTVSPAIETCYVVALAWYDL
jgi:hypothetical protein